MWFCQRLYWMAEVLITKTMHIHVTTVPNVMTALPNMGGAVCSTPQFGWRPLVECRALTLPRRETRWNLQRCLKHANRSQPVVCWSSPYCKNMWGRYCCLTIFFRNCQYVPLLQRYGLTMLLDGAEMAIFCVLYFQRAARSTFRTCILN